MASPLRGLEQLVKGGALAPAIDEALQPVFAANDASVVAPLLFLLSDDADDDAMWSLLHAAESFDDKNYVCEALKVLPLLNETSPRWSQIVVIRMLNSESTRSQLTGQVRLAPKERTAALRSVCARIDRKNARLAEGLAELDAALA